MRAFLTGQLLRLMSIDARLDLIRKIFESVRLDADPAEMSLALRFMRDEAVTLFETLAGPSVVVAVGRTKRGGIEAQVGLYTSDAELKARGEEIRDAIVAILEQRSIPA